jgi:hypothetical protein
MKINVNRMKFNFRGDLMDMTVYPTRNFVAKVVAKQLGWGMNPLPKRIRSIAWPKYSNFNSASQDEEQKRLNHLLEYGTYFTLHRRQVTFLWDMMEENTDVKPWDLWLTDGVIRQVQFSKFSIVVKDSNGKDVWYTIPWDEYKWKLEHFAKKKHHQPTCTDDETWLHKKDLRRIKRRYRSRVRVMYDCDVSLVDKEAAGHISHLVTIAHNSFYQDGNADDCLAVIHVGQDGWGNWNSKQGEAPYEKPSFGWSIMLYAKSDAWDWGALKNGDDKLIVSKDGKYWLPDKRIQKKDCGAGFVMNGGLIWHGEEYSVHT